MQEKGHDVLFQPRCNLYIVHKMAAVYVQSFTLIQWIVVFLFQILYQDGPNMPNLFIINFSCSKLCTHLKQ